MPLFTAPARSPFIGTYDPKLQTNVTTVVNAASTRQFATLAAVLSPVSVATAYFRVGTQDGNIEYSIWSSDGTTLTCVATTGSFACPAAGVRNQALLAAGALNPGLLYYAGFWADGTAAVGGLALSAFVGSVRPAGDAASVAASTVGATYAVASLGGNAKGFVVTFE